MMRMGIGALRIVMKIANIAKSFTKTYLKLLLEISKVMML